MRSRLSPFLKSVGILAILFSSSFLVSAEDYTAKDLADMVAAANGAVKTSSKPEQRIYIVGPKSVIEKRRNANGDLEEVTVPIYDIISVDDWNQLGALVQKVTANFGPSKYKAAVYRGMQPKSIVEVEGEAAKGSQFILKGGDVLVIKAW